MPRKKKSNQKVFNWKSHFPSKIDAVENFQAALYLTSLDQNSIFGLREAHRGFLLLLLGCLFFHSWHLPAFPAIFNLVIILAIAAFYCAQNASSHWTQLAGICANSKFLSRGASILLFLFWLGFNKQKWVALSTKHWICTKHSIAAIQFFFQGSLAFGDGVDANSIREFKG